MGHLPCAQLSLIRFPPITSHLGCPSHVEITKVLLRAKWGLKGLSGQNLKTPFSQKGLGRFSLNSRKLRTTCHMKWWCQPEKRWIFSSKSGLEAGGAVVYRLQLLVHTKLTWWRPLCNVGPDSRLRRSTHSCWSCTCPQAAAGQTTSICSLNWRGKTGDCKPKSKFHKFIWECWRYIIKWLNDASLWASRLQSQTLWTLGVVENFAQNQIFNCSRGNF